jgi:hypothetical protein
MMTVPAERCTHTAHPETAATAAGDTFAAVTDLLHDVEPDNDTTLTGTAHIIRTAGGGVCVVDTWTGSDGTIIGVEPGVATVWGVDNDDLINRLERYLRAAVDARTHGAHTNIALGEPVERILLRELTTIIRTHPAFTGTTDNTLRRVVDDICSVLGDCD